jgi:hypothetical protein
MVMQQAMQHRLRGLLFFVYVICSVVIDSPFVVFQFTTVVIQAVNALSSLFFCARSTTYTYCTGGDSNHHFLNVVF